VTTPERLRRRQQIEGAFLFVIGILLVVSTLWFNHQDEQQRACIGKNFTDLSASLEVRSAGVEAESRTNRAESRANQRFFRDAFAAKTEADVFEAYAKYRVALDHIDQRRERITEERRENPIPEFPAGTCD
jgi:hypothetical protein